MHKAHERIVTYNTFSWSIWYSGMSLRYEIFASPLAAADRLIVWLSFTLRCGLVQIDLFCISRDKAAWRGYIEKILVTCVFRRA